MALSYPYDLNLNARRAALQTDLRALGYSGATVALASSVVTITLPSVTLSAGFGAGAHFFTDPRPYYDLWGNIEYTNQQNATLTNASSPGYTFRGDVHQFCRLRAYSLASDPPQLI
jgi:hypothetical protein